MLVVSLAALAGAALGSLTVAVRWGLARVDDGALGAAAAALIACVLSALAAATGRVDDPARLWPFFLVGMLVPGASQILLTLSVRDVGAARAATYMATTPLLSVLIAITLLGESVRLPLVLGAALIVSGGVALAAERLRPAGYRMRGALLAVACAALFAGRDNVMRLLGRDGHPPPLACAAATLGGAALSLGVFHVVRRRPSPPAIGVALRAFAPAGACLAVGYAALLTALDEGRVTVVAPLAATGSLWAMLLAALVYRGDESIGRRVAGAAALVVAGAALVGATG